MRIIKDNPDMMKSVVIMDRGCGHKEYYGMIVMRDGMNYCRNCIYDIWSKESNYKWKPNPDEDYRFPLYSDGKDYYSEVNPDAE